MEQFTRLQLKAMLLDEQDYLTKLQNQKMLSKEGSDIEIELNEKIYDQFIIIKNLKKRLMILEG